MKPQARRTDVIVQGVGTDVLVYDQLRDAAHSLNATAAYLYWQADGTRTVAELATGMSHALGVPDDARLVEEGLAQLTRVDLLESGRTTDGRAVSRREVVRRLGALAAAMPIVTSIVTPTPLMAQSRQSSLPSVHSGRSHPSSPSKKSHPSNTSHPSTRSHASTPSPYNPPSSFDWKRWLEKLKQK